MYSGITRIINIMNIAFLCLIINLFKLLKFGTNSLCLVFSINLSNINIKLGNSVNTTITPINTPFAITIPRSDPSVNCIAHRARKPTIVVSELPVTDLNVSLIASIIASIIASSLDL